MYCIQCSTTDKKLVVMKRKLWKNNRNINKTMDKIGYSLFLSHNFFSIISPQLSLSIRCQFLSVIQHIRNTIQIGENCG